MVSFESISNETLDLGSLFKLNRKLCKKERILLVEM